MEAKKQLKHLIIYCNPNPKSLSAVLVFATSYFSIVSDCFWLFYGSKYSFERGGDGIDRNVRKCNECPGFV